MRSCLEPREVAGSIYRSCWETRQKLLGASKEEPLQKLLGASAEVLRGSPEVTLDFRKTEFLSKVIPGETDQETFSRSSWELI
jgi:hypothetical protein